jgi:hypothetical protein
MIHLMVEVPNPAELLDPQAYDAGALLRWESSATIDGTYVEGGTVAIELDKFVYDVWDDAGVNETWYRTRVSDATPSTYSPYSEPFQPASGQIYLTIAQLKALMPTTLGDEALLILLDASASEIVASAGRGGTLVERRRSSGELLPLARTAGGVTTVVENGLTLDPSDYELTPTGQNLRRLRDGTNPSHRWRGRVVVTYVALGDTANRQRVQLELVRLTVAFSAGLASQMIGTWTESYQLNPRTVAEQREDILATLWGGEVGIF